MNEKHTPGPWKVEVDENFPWGKILSAKNVMIASLHGQNTLLDELIDNAYLIASAWTIPDLKAENERMKEALSYVVKEYRKPSGADRNLPAAIRTAREVLQTTQTWRN